MINAKRLEEFRKAWADFSMMSNISVSKHTLIELHDTLSAALKVVDVVKEMVEAKQIALYEVWTGGLGPKLKEALAPFAEEKVQEGICGLCGKPLPEGEKMFKFHGYSGNCPS